MPSCVYNPIPTNGASGVSTTPTLFWISASSYQEGNFPNVVLNSFSPPNVNPGYNGRLSVTLQNTGTADAQGVSATLSTTNTNVQISGTNPQAYGTLTAGGGEATAYYSFSLAAGIPAGTIPFHLAVTTSDGSYTAGLDFNVTINGTSPDLAMSAVYSATHSGIDVTYTNTGTGASTTITSGILQIGNGGTIGSIGTGSIADNAELDFDRSDSVTISRAISGVGSLVQFGSGKLILAADNTYTGTTTVSNGVLIINGANSALSTYVAGGTLGGTGTLSGPVTTDPGTTLAPGSTDGTLTINSDLSIGGNLRFEVNKSWTPLSNDFVVVTGVLTNTGTGTLTVTNLGPALRIGDKFTLFSQPVTNGAALTVIGSGATWTNNLADDGSITVLTAPPTVNTNPPVMHVSVSGSTLSLAWPTNLGWTLLTNSVGLTATSQWFPYSGSASITNVNITINPGKTNVFFRMVYPYP